MQIMPPCNGCNNPLTASQDILYRRGMKQFLNASEVAKLLQVDRATVSRWIKKGMLRAERPHGAQQWRVPLAAYEQFVKQYEGR